MDILDQLGERANRDGLGGKIFIDAYDEIKRLRSALETVRSFLANKPWGSIGYMEGSEIYSDLRNQIAAVDAVLEQ